MAETSLEMRLDEFAPWVKEGLGRALQQMDWDRVFRSIGLMLQSSTNENFAKEQEPDGTPWKPLKRPRTRSKGMGKADQAQGERDKILQDTSVLIASVTSRPNKHSVENIIESMEGVSLEWGTNVEYAVYHQQPNGPGKGIIPRRQFLGFNNSLEEEITDFLADEIAEAMFEEK